MSGTELVALGLLALCADGCDSAPHRSRQAPIPQRDFFRHRILIQYIGEL
jgi:hypothetical protein